MGAKKKGPAAMPAKAAEFCTASVVETGDLFFCIGHTAYDSCSLVLWYSFSCWPRFSCPDSGAIAPENEARHSTAVMIYFCLRDQFYGSDEQLFLEKSRRTHTRGSRGWELGWGIKLRCASGASAEHENEWEGSRSFA